MIFYILFVFTSGWDDPAGALKIINSLTRFRDPRLKFYSFIASKSVYFVLRSILTYIGDFCFLWLLVLYLLDGRVHDILQLRAFEYIYSVQIWINHRFVIVPWGFLYPWTKLYRLLLILGQPENHWAFFWPSQFYSCFPTVQFVFLTGDTRIPLDSITNYFS